MTTSEFIDLDGPVHYIDHGGEGAPMLMVHGLGGSYLSWEDVGPRFAATHRVYAIDLAGFGLTPPAGRKTTIEANQQLVQKFCEAAAPGEPFVIVGNSMGGLIAMLQAAANPANVDALVLINPALPLVDLGGVNLFPLQRLVVPTLPGVGEAAMRRYYENTTPEQQVRETIDVIMADPSVVSEERMAANIEMQKVRREMEWAIPSFVVASRSIASALTRVRSFRKMLHKISAKTLLIHGDQDRVVGPRSAEWAAKQRPDWRFQMFHGVGHMPMVERPDAFVEVVNDFLSTQSA